MRSSGDFLEIPLGGPLGTLGVAGPEVRARNVGVEHDLSKFPPVDDRSGSPKKIAPGISGKVNFSRILQIAFIYKRFWRGISVPLGEDSEWNSQKPAGGAKRSVPSRAGWKSESPVKTSRNSNFQSRTARNVSFYIKNAIVPSRILHFTRFHKGS